VIAGWAEREAVVELLPTLGIELAQGHYFGPPAAELRRHTTVAAHRVPHASPVPGRTLEAVVSNIAATGDTNGLQHVKPSYIRAM
jgi:EAL domain-containing protein (putative c-di-GMP-specific phosphodiesterase class I)